MIKPRAQTLGVRAILIAYSALALGPILLVVMNSFKARNAIFGRRSPRRARRHFRSSAT